MFSFQGRGGGTTQSASGCIVMNDLFKGLREGDVNI